MEYDGINSVVCDAEESDWLDVSYTERKYVRKKPSGKRKVAQKAEKRKIKTAWKVAIVAVLCVAVLATMLFVDGDFRNDVFTAVKTATATIFNTGDAEKAENKINIPCNLTLTNVADGVMTFEGGRVALALTAGEVKDITEDSVTIALDDDTSIVYMGLTSTYVELRDKVSANDLLGKYDGSFTAMILQNGEIVKQVVGSETQLTWNV